MDEVASYTSAPFRLFLCGLISAPPTPRHTHKTIGPFCEFLWVEGIRKLQPEGASLAPSRAEITLGICPTPPPTEREDGEDGDLSKKGLKSLQRLCFSLGTCPKLSVCKDQWGQNGFMRRCRLHHHHVLLNTVPQVLLCCSISPRPSPSSSPSLHSWPGKGLQEVVRLSLFCRR